MIRVECEVTIYEKDGKSTTIADREQFDVVSHWNQNAWVCIHIGDIAVTVNGKDLITAIENAMNTGSRF